MVGVKWGRGEGGRAGIEGVLSKEGDYESLWFFPFSLGFFPCPIPQLLAICACNAGYKTIVGAQTEFLRIFQSKCLLVGSPVLVKSLSSLTPWGGKTRDPGNKDSDKRLWQKSKELYPSSVTKRRLLRSIFYLYYFTSQAAIQTRGIVETLAQ